MKSNTPLSCWYSVILELNKLLKTSFDGLCLHKTNPYVSTTTVLWLNGIVSSPKESRAFHKGRKSLQKGRLIIQKRHFQFRDSTGKEKGARCLFMGLRNKSSCCATTGAKKRASQTSPFMSGWDVSLTKKSASSLFHLLYWGFERAVLFVITSSVVRLL